MTTPRNWNETDLDRIGAALGRVLWCMVAGLGGWLLAINVQAYDNPTIGGQVIGGVQCQEDEALALSPAGPVCVNIEEPLDTTTPPMRG